ncbi:MAG: hypothetical protein IPM29_18615 [Planctomycetes bacterium]|nr:hypothetical protein [Planctomycetota bacterium]
MWRSLATTTLLFTCVAAQQPAAPASSTRAVVTPDGVFYAVQSAPGSAPTPATGLTDSPAGLRWTYADPNRITGSVSVGFEGTMAWLGGQLNGPRLSLVSTTDDAGNPPLPIYENLLASSETPSVKAADDGSAAVLARNASGGGATVEYLTCFSATPQWSVSYASGVEVAISDDGRYVAVGFSPTTMSAQIDVYDARSATPTTPIAVLTATTHGLRQLDISGDGSTVLMATNTDNHVFDVATQTQIFTDSSTVSHDAHAINYDGSVWGRGGFNPVRAWVRSGGTYNLVLSYSDSTLGFPVFTAADVSADGSTFVAAAYDAQGSARLRVFCWSLTPTGSTLLWVYASDGTGSRQTTPQAVSISDDGELIAVGTWGDEFNAHAEVLVFSRTVGNVPIQTLDTPGSCYDLDISGDGQFVVVGTKAVHANVFGRGGEGYSLDLGGQRYWQQGTASLGRTITLNADGAQGDGVFLAFASQRGPGISIPGIAGTLELDVGSLLGVVFVGTVPAGGTLGTMLSVPNVPVVVGRTLWTQSLMSPPFRFENLLLVPLTP